MIKPLYGRQEGAEFGCKAPALPRGDCGFGNEDVIEVGEQRDLPELPRLRKTDRLPSDAPRISAVIRPKERLDLHSATPSRSSPRTAA
jgi:hypothetical protein